MKKSRRKEFRSKEDKELTFDLKTLRKELFDLRFQSASEKLPSPSRIRTVRREIALVNTLLRERDLKIHGEQHR
ncbi:MAG: 50S ribosomal protein L29 [Planctomycetota bacterium]